jgi:hypothetical protein
LAASHVHHRQWHGRERHGGSRSISVQRRQQDRRRIESVGEVNIVKGIMPAEHGNAMGGNFNIITKAGRT